MEDRDQLILKILKHIKCLRKDIREMRKSMDLAAKIVYTNKEVMEQLDVSTAVLKKWRDSGLIGYSKINNNDTVIHFLNLNFNEKLKYFAEMLYLCWQL